MSFTNSSSSPELRVGNSLVRSFTLVALLKRLTRACSLLKERRSLFRSHGSLIKRQLEQIALIALLKRANRAIRSFLSKKNKQFALKTKERIPTNSSIAHLRASLLVLAHLRASLIVLAHLRTSLIVRAHRRALLIVLAHLRASLIL